MTFSAPKPDAARALAVFENLRRVLTDDDREYLQHVLDRKDSPSAPRARDRREGKQS
jgi:hypothetical protein